MKESEHDIEYESENMLGSIQEAPAYTSNLSGDDILGCSDLYVNPLAALFTQNMVVAPFALTGIPPFNPYNLRERGEEEEEDKLRR